MTLVGLACSSPLEPGIVEQVEYLVKRQKADVTITDTGGNNAVRDHQRKNYLTENLTMKFC